MELGYILCMLWIIAKDDFKMVREVFIPFVVDYFMNIFLTSGDIRVEKVNLAATQRSDLVHRGLEEREGLEFKKS